MSKSTTKKKTLSEQIQTERVESGSGAPAGDKLSLTGKVQKTRTRRKGYVMDLRIHSPSSLGYLSIDGIDTAPALVRLARVKGLDVIAVTDFYSAAFVDRVKIASADSALTVIPGVVIRASVDGCNDVILSCLFPEHFDTKKVNQFLKALKVPDTATGDQSYVVKRDLRGILKVVDRYNGLAIPSRMDKTPSRKAVLPLLVEEYGFRAFDLAYFPESKNYFKKLWPQIKFQLLSFSNASALAQVGSRNSRVMMRSPGFAGLHDVIQREVA